MMFDSDSAITYILLDIITRFLSPQIDLEVRDPVSDLDSNTTVLSTSFRKIFFAWRFTQKK